jgi:hypothetical protein
MLPEAYLKGGNVVGLSTLAGFLIAIFSKALEPVDATGHQPRSRTEPVVAHVILSRRDNLIHRTVMQASYNVNLRSVPSRLGTSRIVRAEKRLTHKRRGNTC